LHVPLEAGPSSRIPMAIVTDSYGGVAGLVTVEYLL